MIQLPPSYPAQALPSEPGDTAGERNASGTIDLNRDENGEPIVTDPELLELLEQLSVTIETANTVLDAAATLPEGAEETTEENAPETAKPTPVTAGQDGGEREPEPKPGPEPEPDPVPDREDLPPLAARLAPDPAAAGPAPAPNAPKDRFGFGLVANTALTGLVFSAGVAWVLHTNPWLLDKWAEVRVKLPAQVAKTDPKLQTQLPAKLAAVQSVAAKPSPAPASFAPPDDDPAPMETASPAAPELPAGTPAPAHGTVGQAVALNVRLPAHPGEAEMSAMIQGVPQGAKLSAGKNLGAGNWLLNEQQLEGVALTTSKKFKPGNYDLEVILVRSDGKVPETLKVPVSVGPMAVAAAVNAPPAVPIAQPETKPHTPGEKTVFTKPGVAIQVAASPALMAPVRTESQLAPQEIRMLLTRGDALLREGDVAGARLLLEYAAKSGSKPAMVKLGNSYDPEHLAKLGVRGVQPNEAMAVHWYDRAARSAAEQ